MARLTREVEERLRVAFTGLAAGDDLPPGVQLRLEGLLEAAYLAGEASPAQLQDRIDAVHRDVFGASLAEVCGEAWRDLYPFPELPPRQSRAPVTPSTDD